jgi:hypothetical protein
MIKEIQVVYSEGSDDSTIQRLEYTKRILTTLIPEIKILYMRDKDLLSNEVIKKIKEDASIREIPVYISEYRNRESFFINPELIEKAITQNRKTLPDDLNGKGKIVELVKEIVAEWCYSELDNMPYKIRHANTPLINKFFDKETANLNITNLDKFVREKWTEVITENLIPSELIDGKAILRLIRTKLHEYKIDLPEKDLLSVINEDDFDLYVKEVVKELVTWFS